MFRLVIFDMDGLMFDTEHVMCRAFLETTSAMGYHSTRDQFLSLLGLNERDIQEKYRQYYGEGVDAEAIYSGAGRRREQILAEEGIPLKPGLYELLDAIDELGLMKAVASSSNLETIQDNLKQAGLSGRFDLVLSGRQVRRGKPYPDLFLAVCKKLDVRPEEALVLEDSPNGVEAAAAGGIPVIQIPDLSELTDRTKEKCLAVVPSLNQVIPFLKQS